MAGKRANSDSKTVRKSDVFCLGPRHRTVAAAHHRLDELGSRLNGEFDAIGEKLNAVIEFLKVSLDESGHIKPEALRRSRRSASPRGKV